MKKTTFTRLVAFVFVAIMLFALPAAAKRQPYTAHTDEWLERYCEEGRYEKMKVRGSIGYFSVKVPNEDIELTLYSGMRVYVDVKASSSETKLVYFNTGAFDTAHDPCEMMKGPFEIPAKYLR